jgi:hypothetical protein
MRKQALGTPFVHQGGGNPAPFSGLLDGKHRSTSETAAALGTPPPVERGQSWLLVVAWPLLRQEQPQVAFDALPGKSKYVPT